MAQETFRGYSSAIEGLLWQASPRSFFLSFLFVVTKKAGPGMPPPEPAFFLFRSSDPLVQLTGLEAEPVKRELLRQEQGRGCRTACW